MSLRLLLLLLAVSILLSGCAQGEEEGRKSSLGFKTVSECNQEHVRPSPRIQCYHQAAVSMAYLGDYDAAGQICASIWSRFSGLQSDEDDIRRKAELAHNNCYYDVARISGDEWFCGSIQAQDDLGVSLVGDEVTRESCIQRAEKVRDHIPENFHQLSDDSMCNMFFVLPLILVLTLRREHP